MPEQINNPVPVTEESKIDKYAPIAKAIAAIGVGAFGNSPAARGIATGLASSAQQDVRIKQLMDEQERKDRVAEMKARTAKLKQSADFMWQTANAMESVEARNMYLENVGYEDIVSEITGMQFELPESFAADTELLEFDATPFKEAIANIEDPQQQALAKASLTGMIRSASVGDVKEFRMNQQNFQDVTAEPELIQVFDENNNVAYVENIEDAPDGYIFKTPSRTERTLDENQIQVMNKYIKVSDKAANIYKSALADDMKRWDTNFIQLWDEMQASNEKLISLATFQGKDPAIVMSPYPGIIDGAYEIYTASKMIKAAISTGAIPITADNENNEQAIREYVKSNQAEIKSRAGEMYGDDSGKSVTVVKPKKSAPAKDRVATQVADLQGVDKSNKSVVRKRLKDNGYTPSEITAIFKQLGW